MFKLLSATLALYGILSAQTCPQPTNPPTMHYHTAKNGTLLIDTDPMPPELVKFLVSIRKSLPTPHTPFNRWTTYQPSASSTSPIQYDGTGPIPEHCWVQGSCWIFCCFGTIDCWTQCTCCGDNLQ